MLVVVNAGDVLPRDFDLDGLLDLAVLANPVGGPNRTLQIYRGSAPWQFELAQVRRIGFSANLLGIDLDNAGSDEIILADSTNRVVQVFRLHSDAFSLVQEIYIGSWVGKLDLWDVDTDGLDDVVVWGLQGSGYAVLRNLGTGRLEEAESLFLALRASAPQLVADLDNDGLAEVIASEAIYSHPFLRNVESTGSWSTEPALRLESNAAVLGPGQALRAALALRGGRHQVAVDLYIGALLPDGSWVFLSPLGWTHELAPFAPGLQIGPCVAWTDIWEVEGEVPVDLAPGKYELWAAVTRTGTLALLDRDHLELEVLP
jgi:hypothetical protein